jgi:uncharacterized protein (TIGR02444 family)
MADIIPDTDKTENAFWRFSLFVYAAPGVAEECLALQDTHGVDVNLLLFASWLGGCGIALSDAALAEACALVAPWCDTVVRPLRIIRRQLNGDPQVEPFRRRIRELELDAERHEQDLLFTYAKLCWKNFQVYENDAVLTSNIVRYLEKSDARMSANDSLSSLKNAVFAYSSLQ